MNWSASGDFTNISYSIRREEGLYTLKIDPHEKSWGPNFLQVGITGAVDSHSQTDFGVTGVLRRSWMNSYGAEWTTKGLLSKKRQLESAWFQPLGTRSHYFLESKLNLSAEPIRVFADDKAVGEFLTERGELGLSAGIQSQLGKIQLGFLTGDIRRSSTTGFTRLPPAKAQYSGWRVQAIYDQLDDLDFPRFGTAFKLDGFSSNRLKRLEADWLTAKSWGNHTLRARALLARVPNDGSETLDFISSGGLMKLSGYQTGQFLSRGLALGSLTYYGRVVNLPQPFGSGVFAGASLELARLDSPLGLQGTKANKHSLAFFLGASTSLGPLYLGYGLGKHGARNVYVVLGRP